jgi:hypothetical protein
MGATVVRYMTKPERAEENQALVEAVFAELAETEPSGLRYETYRLADGVSFVHVASIDTEDGSNPLGATAAFAAFLQGIGDRCAEPPLASEATKIGSYAAGTPAVRS